MKLQPPKSRSQNSVPPLEEWTVLMKNVATTPDEDSEIWNETVGDGIVDNEIELKVKVNPAFIPNQWTKWNSDQKKS